MKKPEPQIGSRRFRSPIHVLHSTLQRYGDSVYRSACPCCSDGILLVRRDSNGQLMPTDWCVACGQAFVYDDIHIGVETVQLGAGRSAIFLNSRGPQGPLPHVTKTKARREARQRLNTVGEGEEI